MSWMEGGVPSEVEQLVGGIAGGQAEGHEACGMGAPGALKVGFEI